MEESLRTTDLPLQDPKINKSSKNSKTQINDDRLQGFLRCREIQKLWISEDCFKFVASYFEVPREMFCSWLYNMVISGETMNTLVPHGLMSFDHPCFCPRPPGGFLPRSEEAAHPLWVWMAIASTLEMRDHAPALGALWEWGHPSRMGHAKSLFSDGFQKLLKPWSSHRVVLTSYRGSP